MPYHVLFDQLEEQRLGSKSFGSTKSGIAPFYADKYLKIGIQVGELFDDDLLRERLERACAIKNETLKSLYPGNALLDVDSIYDEMTGYRNRLRPLVADTAQFLNDACLLYTSRCV